MHSEYATTGFGAGLDAGLVCYGLMEDETSMRAGLVEYVAGSKAFSPIRSGEHASMEKSGPVSPVPKSAMLRVLDPGEAVINSRCKRVGGLSARLDEGESYLSEFVMFQSVNG